MSSQLPETPVTEKELKYSSSQPSSSIPNILQRLSLADSSEFSELYAKNAQIACNYLARGQYAEAEKELSAVLASMKELKNPQLSVSNQHFLASIQHKLGLAQNYLGDFPKAEETLKKAILNLNAISKFNSDLELNKLMQSHIAVCKKELSQVSAPSSFSRLPNSTRLTLPDHDPLFLPASPVKNVSLDDFMNTATGLCEKLTQQTPTEAIQSLKQARDLFLLTSKTNVGQASGPKKLKKQSQACLMASEIFADLADRLLSQAKKALTQPSSNTDQILSDLSESKLTAEYSLRLHPENPPLMDTLEIIEAHIFTLKTISHRNELPQHQDIFDAEQACATLTIASKDSKAYQQVVQKCEDYKHLSPKTSEDFYAYGLNLLVLSRLTSKVEDLRLANINFTFAFGSSTSSDEHPHYLRRKLQVLLILGTTLMKNADEEKNKKAKGALLEETQRYFAEMNDLIKDNRYYQKLHSSVFIKLAYYHINNHEDTNRTTLALASLEQAKAADPHNPDVFYEAIRFKYLIKAKIELNEVKQACRFYENSPISTNDLQQAIYYRNHGFLLYKFSTLDESPSRLRYAKSAVRMLGKAIEILKEQQKDNRHFNKDYEDVFQHLSTLEKQAAQSKTSSSQLDSKNFPPKILSTQNSTPTLPTTAPPASPTTPTLPTRPGFPLG